MEHFIKLIKKKY